jgi:hypothetical protein
MTAAMFATRMFEDLRPLKAMWPGPVVHRLVDSLTAMKGMRVVAQTPVNEAFHAVWVHLQHADGACMCAVSCQMNNPPAAPMPAAAMAQLLGDKYSKARFETVQEAIAKGTFSWKGSMAGS